MFDRLELLIGKENLNNISKKKILLAGLGGVGGMSFEMLVRNGFENITIIDYDVFEKSNLNRQILSNNKNIGFSKTDVACERAHNINSKITINKLNIKIDEESIKSIDNDYDYIIDAIDDVKAKILLIKHALKNNIKIISSMGIGNKEDPTKLEITNIWKTNYDPLAKKIRYELKKEKISYKLPVVASKEAPIKGKTNKIASSSIVTNYAGILLTYYVIKDIINNS